MEIIKTIGTTPTISRRRAPAGDAGSRWDVVTSVMEIGGSQWATRMEIVHTVQGKTDSCVLPTVQGFATRSDAAAYVMAWIHAWSGVNR